MRCQRVVLVDGEVRDADHRDLACGDQLVKRGGDVGRVSEHVGPVDLPQVDVFDTESGERSVDRRAEILRARVIGQRRHDAALGGQDHAISKRWCRGEYFAESLFVLAKARAPVIEAINIGGVDQVHAVVESGLDEFLVRSDVVRGQSPCAVSKGADLWAIATQCSVGETNEV